MGRIGSGVQVSVSFRQKYPPGSALSLKPQSVTTKFFVLASSNASDITVAICSDVNKDLGPKAKDARPRPRPWGIKAKAKDLGPARCDA